MALRRYTVNHNGQKTEMQLNEKDAERMGATPVEDAPNSDQTSDADTVDENGGETAARTRRVSNRARG